MFHTLNMAIADECDPNESTNNKQAAKKKYAM